LRWAWSLASRFRSWESASNWRRPGLSWAIGFVFISGALTLAGSWAADAPRRLGATGLMILVCLAAAMMVQPFVFSPPLIAAAAILGCLLVVRRDGSPGRAPALLMAAYTLAMMAILVAGWLIEVGGVTASALAPARAATILLGLGLAIIVVAPPFHTWLTATASESHPLALVFLATALQSSGLFLLLNSLASYPWMRSDPLVSSTLRGAGLFMIALGSLWCVAERRAPRIIAYALLVDFGVSLLALSTATAGGYGTALGMAGARAAGAAVWAFGFSNLSDSTSPGVERKPARKLAVMAALAGAFSLAGLPLTAGFAGRWLTLAALSADTTATSAVILGIVAVGISSMRWARLLDVRASPVAAPLPRGRRTLLRIGAASIVILGLLPGWLYAWALPALSGLTGLLPPPAP